MHAKPTVSQEGNGDGAPQISSEAACRPDMPRSALPSQVRHDLRTHLNQILGYSELLMDDAQERGWPEAVSDLQSIYLAGRNLLTLINDYIDPAHAQDAPQTDTRRRDATAGPAIRAEKAAPQEDLAHGALLVVDDNPPNRQMLARSLQRQGYTVAVAAEGPQALEKVRAEPFDLILLDVLLPEMDGYEVLLRLKEDPDLRHIPVLMVSALDDMESVIRCIQAG